MNKKTFIYIILCILLIFSVNAQPPVTDDLQMCLSFDVNYDDDYGSTSVNVTDNGGLTHFSSGGIQGGYYNFSRDGSYFRVGQSLPASSPYTVVAWGYTANTNEWKQFIVGSSTGGSNKHSFVLDNSGNAVYYKDGSYGAGASVAYGTGAWHMYVLRSDGTTLTINYDSGTNNTATGGGVTTNYFDLGWAIAGATNSYRGGMDEIMYFNRTITDAEISTLYNGGSGYTCVTPPVTNYFLINATDNYGNTINIFNATVNGTFYNTSSGVINTTLLSNLSVVLNITVQAENYFDTKVEHNIASDYQAIMRQTIINFNSYKRFNNAAIQNFSVTDNTISDTTTNGTATLNLLQGNTTITFSSVDGYYNKSFNVEVVALDNLTLNITDLYNSLTTIYGYNYSGGNLSNMTVNVYYNSVLYDNFTVNTNSLTINLTQGINYSIYATSRPDFTINHHTNTKIYNPSGVTNNFNFTLYQDQSIWFQARDILSSNLLNLLSLFLYGSTQYNYTFNQTIFDYGLDIGNYDLIASKSGYTDFTQTISINEGSLTNVTALMTNVSSTVIFIVTDVFGNGISGATVTITRNSDGSTVSTGTTDGFGEISFSLNSLINYNILVDAGSLYKTFSESLNVIEDTYSITLDFASTTNNYYTGVIYSFKPVDGTPLSNSTVYEFNTNFSSNYWTITGCWYNIYNGSNSVYSDNSFCSATNGFSNTSINTSGYEQLQNYLVLEVNGTNITFYKYYSIKSDYQGDFSLMTLITDIKSFDKAGFDGLSRFILVIIGIVGIVMYLASEITISSKSTDILLFITLLVTLASYWDLVTLTNVPFAGQYIIAIFLGVMTITNYVMEEKR